MKRKQGGYGGTSRRYHTKHTQRVLSHYPQRLAARGISSAQVRMADLHTLRHHQATPGWLAAHPWIAENLDKLKKSA